MGRRQTDVVFGWLRDVVAGEPLALVIAAAVAAASLAIILLAIRRARGAEETPLPSKKRRWPRDAPPRSP